MMQVTQLRKKPSTRVVTPEMVLSFPRLFVPDSGPDGTGEERYSACLVALAPAVATPEWATVKKAALQAAVNKFGEKAIAMVKEGKLKMPFRDDVEDRGYPEGSVFFNARSKQKPGVVGRTGVELAGKFVPRPITEEDQQVGGPYEMYSGCKVRASITFYYFDKAGNKGVAAALNNVQRLGEGDRLDNRKAASDEFEADMSEAPASLEDVM